MQPAGHDLIDLPDHLLAVTKDECIHEVRQGFGVEDAMTSGQHQCIGVPTVRAVQRKARQVDHVDEIRVDELGRQVEGQHVEGGCRQVLLDAEKGYIRRPHGGLHVDPGGIGPLSEGIGSLVEDLVEDLEALVRQPDLVGVGIEKQPGDGPSGVLGVHRPLFTTDIPSRFGHRGQDAFDLRPEGLHRR